MAVKTPHRRVKVASTPQKAARSPRPVTGTRPKVTAPIAIPLTRQQKAGEAAKPSRKYLSPAMLGALVRESPVPPAANRGPAKPPFELQES